MESLVFVRIPRTSSTSLFMALGKVWGNVLATSEVEMAASGLGMNAFIHGHILARGPHWQRIAREARTLTVLREPVDRIVSLYYRFRLDPGYPFHKELQTMTIADFVASGQHAQTHQANNDQVRRLSEIKFGFGENCWSAVDAALENLARFTVVGVYGWQRPLRAVLRHRLGVELPNLDRVSTGQARLTTGQLDPADLEAIQEYNQLDLVLYGAAVARLCRDVREVGCG